MKRLTALSIIALSIAAPSAFADDWSGVYGGLYAGGALVNAKAVQHWDLSGGTPDDPLTYKANSGNIIAGLVMGANAQSGSIVYGLEADLGIGGGGSGQQIFLDGTPNPDWKYNLKSLMSGSARVRVGYDAGSFMPFVTGGVAFKLVQTDLTFCIEFVPDCPTGNYTGTGGLIGWTAGAGLDYAIDSNSTVGFEYRYANYGPNDLGVWHPAVGGNPRAEGFRTDLQEHDLRLSYKYRFGSVASSAKDAVDETWSGFYGGAYGGGGMQDLDAINLWDISGNDPDPDRLTKTSKSAFGGILLGGSKQVGSAVIGIETDLGTGGSVNGPRGDIGGFDPNTDWKFTSDLSGSARVRLGYAGQSLMPFVTAGAAFNILNVKMTDCNNGCTDYVDFVGKVGIVGWTAGFGADYAISQDLFAGVEYRHTDYGTVDTSGIGPGVPGQGEYQPARVKLAQDDVRLSLKVRF